MSQNPGTLGSNPRISFIRVHWPVYETSGRCSKTKHFCQLPIWAYPGWRVVVRMYNMLMPVACFYRLSVGTINKLGFKSLEVAGCALDKLGRIQIPAVLLSLNFRTCPAVMSCHGATGHLNAFTKRWVHPSALYSPQAVAGDPLLFACAGFWRGSMCSGAAAVSDRVHDMFLYVNHQSTWPIHSDGFFFGEAIFHSCVYNDIIYICICICSRMFHRAILYNVFDVPWAIRIAQGILLVSRSGSGTSFWWWGTGSQSYNVAPPSSDVNVG